MAGRNLRSVVNPPCHPLFHTFNKIIWKYAFKSLCAWRWSYWASELRQVLKLIQYFPIGQFSPSLPEKFAYINILCLSVWVFVCLCPINIKTDEQIRPKFCLGPHMTPWQVNWWSKFQKISLQQYSIVIKFKKSTNFFFKKSANLLLLLFDIVCNEKMLTNEMET